MRQRAPTPGADPSASRHPRAPALRVSWHYVAGATVGSRDPRFWPASGACSRPSPEIGDFRGRTARHGQLVDLRGIGTGPSWRWGFARRSAGRNRRPRLRPDQAKGQRRLDEIEKGGVCSPSSKTGWQEVSGGSDQNPVPSPCSRPGCGWDGSPAVSASLTKSSGSDQSSSPANCLPRSENSAQARIRGDLTGENGALSAATHSVPDSLLPRKSRRIPKHLVHGAETSRRALLPKKA